MIHILYVAIAAYLTIGTCKFILAIPSLPAAVAATAWVITRQKGVIYYRHIALVVGTTLLACYLWWIPLLLSEKHRFFLAYSTREAIREAIYVHRMIEEDRELRHG